MMSANTLIFLLHKFLCIITFPFRFDDLRNSCLILNRLNLSPLIPDDDFSKLHFLLDRTNCQSCAYKARKYLFYFHHELCAIMIQSSSCKNMPCTEFWTSLAKQKTKNKVLSETTFNQIHLSFPIDIS